MPADRPRRHRRRGGRWYRHVAGRWAADIVDLVVAPDDVHGTVIDVRQRSEWDAGTSPAPCTSSSARSPTPTSLPGRSRSCAATSDPAMSGASLLEDSGHHDLAVLIGGPDDSTAPPACHSTSPDGHSDDRAARRAARAPRERRPVLAPCRGQRPRRGHDRPGANRPPAAREDEFGLAAYAATLTFIAAFGIVKAITNFFAGTLSDRCRPQPVLVAGWLVAVPVPLLLMWAPTWGWVIAANVLLGVNQGLTWSTTVIMKIDLVGPTRRRPRHRFQRSRRLRCRRRHRIGDGLRRHRAGLRPRTIPPRCRLCRSWARPVGALRPRDPGLRPP